MTGSNARSKSSTDLARFRELVQEGTRLEKNGQWEKSKSYFNAAMAMVLMKKIYFVQA